MYEKEEMTGGPTASKSGQVSEEIKQRLQVVYNSLNPAQLKRNIEAGLQRLYQAYQGKKGTQQVDPRKKLTPRSVTFFVSQRSRIGLPTYMNRHNRLRIIT